MFQKSFFVNKIWREKIICAFEVFAFCHMMGILSAIANPLLYGYFNQVLFIDFEFLRFNSGLEQLIQWQSIKSLVFVNWLGMYVKTVGKSSGKY